MLKHDLVLVPASPAILEDIYRIVNSNSAYNILENGNPARTYEELEEELNAAGQGSLLIQLDGRSVGILQYIVHNPKDGYPWLGLLMIHQEMKAKGLGKAAFAEFAGLLITQGKHAVRIGVIPENEAAKSFWLSLGFQYYESKMSTIGKVVDCYEKSL
ncbi:GNAT family N-acetyltransferase [Bacillus sp. 3255]|uniref:GNAT family N-acetyltransferase n=1 Tax=Bacillus sp. 3255 TaxID=2817904 RepID=UPI0028650807|nr:GNAT family N-acetyltransferase [Bacillus sp. 3255]MDR6881476.1 GNAT superfamily N-acetyltransferase [Bacillus sp. 3255]